jgi:AraC-like DNA-binding protein
MLPQLTSYSQSRGSVNPLNVKYIIFDTHFSAAEKEEADTLSEMLSIAGHASLCYLFKSLIHLIMNSSGTEIITFKQLSNRTVPNSLEITNFIQSNIRTVTLEDLARNFGYSPNYMEKLIVRKTGIPFKKLLRLLRIELALFYCMSVQDHMTYAELADHCGWSNVSCMKRALKAMNINIRDKRAVK